MTVELGDVITIDDITMTCVQERKTFLGISYMFIYFSCGDLKEVCFSTGELDALGATKREKMKAPSFGPPISGHFITETCTVSEERLKEISAKFRNRETQKEDDAAQTPPMPPQPPRPPAALAHAFTAFEVRPAIKQEIEDGKAQWCAICGTSCPDKGKDQLCICNQFVNRPLPTLNTPRGEE